jgi:hypothetical protein
MLPEELGGIQNTSSLFGHAFKVPYKHEKNTGSKAQVMGNHTRPEGGPKSINVCPTHLLVPPFLHIYQSP